MAAFRTVLLKGDLGRRYEEARASTIVKPGWLLQRDADDASGRPQVKAHATSGGGGELMVAIEDALQGKTINDSYAIGDLVRYFYPEPGDLVNMQLKAGQVIVKNDPIMSNGDGTTTKGTGGTTVNVGSADEALTPGASDGFLAVRVYDV